MISLDLTSTLPFYDEGGKPKEYIPSVYDHEKKIWLYSLNPNRKEAPLEGEALLKHQHDIKNLKERLKNEM